MSEHVATISWKRTDPGFAQGRYSRVHEWTFDGGTTVPASPSPSVVRAPWSSEAAVDPEEAFVASVSSCHMLTFLWLASRAGLVVDSYRDRAVGVMTKNDRGIPWVSRIALHPEIEWEGGTPPSAEALHQLHHGAHEQCFIANSIRTEVVVVS
jgi:organic hydroperoxide reductase OsmC/OhrA